MCRGELGRYNGREGVVTADADTHDEPPNNEDADDTDCMTLTGKSLTESRNDDEHELDAVCIGEIRIS